MEQDIRCQEGQHQERSDRKGILIRDTFEYKNLIPGEKYAASISVYNKETGNEIPSVIVDEGGGPVTATVYEEGEPVKRNIFPFTPKERDGSITLYIRIDATDPIRESAIVYEGVRPCIEAEDPDKAFSFCTLISDLARIMLDADRPDSTYAYGTARHAEEILEQILKSGAKSRHGNAGRQYAGKGSWGWRKPGGWRGCRWKPKTRGRSGQHH